MSLTDNIVNGYIGGHGVRMVLTLTDIANTCNGKVPYNLNLGDWLRLCDKKFKITVYNFNPETIHSNHEYG